MSSQKIYDAVQTEAQPGVIQNSVMKKMRDTAKRVIDIIT